MSALTSLHFSKPLKSQRPRDVARLITLLLAGFALACSAPPAPVELAPTRDVDVTARVVEPPADGGSLAGTRLRWRAGFVLTSGHAHFGGFSGLLVEGDSLLGLSDRGWWWQGSLRHDAAGTLVDVVGDSMGPLLDIDGQPLLGLERADAEELARVEGGIVVAFEREHRLQLYQSTGALELDQGPSSLLETPPLDSIEENGGFEAVTGLADGRLLVFVEGAPDAAGHLPVFLGASTTKPSWRRLEMVASGAFKPTSATELPSGDVLLVERSFNPLSGVRIRLSTLALSQLDETSLASARPLAPAELGRLQPPLPVDNMEAVDVALGPRGETLIYLLSDDNFSQLQDTLLLQLELLGEP